MYDDNPQGQTRCRRGHELRPPNLAGEARCLACVVGKQRVRRNPTLNLDEVADRLYEDITATTQEGTHV